jgi:hypothetical protein
MSYKVKELISRLKQYNPEARVVLYHYNGTPDNVPFEEDSYKYLYNVGWQYEDNGDTNKMQVILGA